MVGGGLDVRVFYRSGGLCENRLDVFKRPDKDVGTRWIFLEISNLVRLSL
jgi:hypothetical protein